MSKWYARVYLPHSGEYTNVKLDAPNEETARLFIEKATRGGRIEKLTKL
tara:strand:- start:548 stop:694 length:147 start_codon:yes stop_codon:yes gene_type:complete